MVVKGVILKIYQEFLAKLANQLKQIKNSCCCCCHCCGGIFDFDAITVITAAVKPCCKDESVIRKQWRKCPIVNFKHIWGTWQIRTLHMTSSDQTSGRDELQSLRQSWRCTSPDKQDSSQLLSDRERSWAIVPTHSLSPDHEHVILSSRAIEWNCNTPWTMTAKVHLNNTVTKLFLLCSVCFICFYLIHFRRFYLSVCSPFVASLLAFWLPVFNKLELSWGKLITNKIYSWCDVMQREEKDSAMT